MKEFNPNIYPPDGYSYVESDGSKHREDSWKKLETRIREYRERNGLPVGDVWADLMNQICAKFPGFCRETTPFQLLPNTLMQFNQRVLEWYAHCVRLKRINGWRRVDEAEAARRADICRRCPKQQSLNTACQACISSIDMARKALMDGAESKHQNLMPCGATGEDTLVSVYGDLPRISDVTLPPECWRKK